jgi:hypothetical protein
MWRFRSGEAMARNVPGDEAIEAEIKWLCDNKPLIRQRNGFGEDLHAAIDAQIRVLEERMDNDAVFDEWDEGSSLLDSALDALRWLEGDGGKPSEGWKELLPKEVKPAEPPAKIPAMIKIKRCPMIRSKVRQRPKTCMLCERAIPVGAMAWRSVCDGNINGVQRYLCEFEGGDVGKNEDHLKVGHGGNFRSPGNPNVRADAAELLAHPENRAAIEVRAVAAIKAA